MCERCVEIDGRISRYIYLKQRTTDAMAVASLNQLIDDMKASKSALHPGTELFQGAR